MKTHHDTIIWLKLDHNFFSLTKDIYLCGSYIWGVDSPAYNVVNCNLFELLESDINYFNQFGTVLVAGDLNGRVGRNNDFIVNDFNNSNFDDEDYIPDVPIPRSTLDIKLRTHKVTKYLTYANRPSSEFVTGASIKLAI